MSEKINVGIYIDEDELLEMKDLSKVDSNGPAVLAMARKGVESERKFQKLRDDK